MKKSKQIGFRLLSMMITLSLAFSCFCFAAVPAAADSVEESIYDAARAYVAAAGNNVTAAGLLSAVQAVEPTATLDTEEDYYFKHAVPGVVDNTNDYPLNIPGSDGALAAVFEVNGDRYPVAVPLAHETETIAITETAIVGTSTGFTYDENGNVTGYSGTADKIVLPADYNGTFLRITDQTSVDNVKVLIYNNKKYVHDYAFYDWDGLVAVQFKSGEAAWRLTGNGSNHNDTRGFASCDNLKYVRLPDIVSLSWYSYVLHNNMFDGCGRLENINHPTLNTSSNKATSWAVFNGTAIRDYVFPQYYVTGTGSGQTTFAGYSANNPTVNAASRNIHFYNDEMTLTRAVALAVAKGNELIRAGVTGTALTDGMLAAITGSADAAEVAEVVSVDITDIVDEAYYFGITVSVVAAGEEFLLTKNVAKGLVDLFLSVPLDQTFDPAVSAYTASVPNDVTAVEVTAVPVEGVTVGTITGNTGLTVGQNLITIPLTTAGGQSTAYTVTVTRRSDALPAAVLAAADSYVKNNQNRVTAAGLLDAVQAVNNSITLDTDNDFYIKHAVPGVKDNTVDYPLSISGSDGAVAAVFGLNGQRYGYTCAFRHETETIAVTETAVVGTSTGFTYDESGNVTAYSGTADKIVIPEGYSGTITQLADLTTVQNVKVVIINNTATTILAGKAFKNWDGLIAVQIADQTTKPFFDQWNDNHNEANNQIFAACDNLKYVKFPTVAAYAGWATLYLPYNCFENSSKLENVKLPAIGNTTNHPIGHHTFAGTALREIILPQYATYNEVNRAYDSATFTGGTRNIHYYTDSMTAVRAAAYAAAAVNSLDSDATVSEFEETALDAITGTADSAEFAAAASLLSAGFSATDYGTKAKAYLVLGSDIFPAVMASEKALADLTSDYPLTPAFDPMISSYTMSVPSHVTEVSVTATPADGATVGSITGTTISGNSTTVVIPVSNTEGRIISYTIAVSKRSVLPNAVYEAANTYVQENKNTVTPEGLLEAVQTVWSGATLAQDGFYIKHATNGVKDNDTVSGYPLSIEGGKGSVTAIITNAGVNYTFNVSFGFETEILHIGSYAIVGDSAYSDVFTYDASGNVTALKRAVEKIIFPAGYNGTMTALTGESLIHADRVKVVIYNNSTAFVSDAFSDWSGLIAFSMDNGTSSFLLGSDANNTREARMFKGCTALKYFKFPEVVNNSYYWNAMFPNSFFEGSSHLETVIMPKRATSGQFTQYGFRTFWGTAVRDVVMPQYNTPITSNGLEIFDSSTTVGGTRNFHPYHEAMTLTRAASLIGVGLSDAKTTDAAALVAFAKALVTGSSDAATFADALTYEWVADTVTNYAVTGRMLISDGTYDIYVKAVISKTLSGLAVQGGQAIDFSATQHSYTVTLPYNMPEIQIDTGMETVSKTVSTNGHTVNVAVENADGNIVNYEITVKRTGTVNAQTLTIVSKALLATNHYDPIDMNVDDQFNILDLIRAKKLSAQEPETASGNVPAISSTYQAIKAEDLTEFLTYFNTSGQAVDTMFDGVAFRPTPAWMYSYSGGTTSLKNTTKRDWSNFLYNNLLQDNYNVNAFETAAGEMKIALNKPNRKVTIFLPLMTTKSGFTGWGELNGTALDFNRDADRINAMKWLIDESIAAFQAKGYENIVLGGFYYIDEAMRDGDMNILPTVTNYIRSKGLITFWAPYSDANGSRPSDTYLWDDYGFDEATYQINYFPGREDLPAARDESYISHIGQNIAAHGANVEMELCGKTKQNISGLKKYFEGGIDYGYMNGDFISWWIAGDAPTMKYLANSSDAYIRSTYDEMYRFIKKTLTKSSINKVTGE